MDVELIFNHLVETQSRVLMLRLFSSGLCHALAMTARSHSTFNPPPLARHHVGTLAAPSALLVVCRNRLVFCLLSKHRRHYSNGEPFEPP